MINRRLPAAPSLPGPPSAHIADPTPVALAASRAEWRRLGRRVAAISPAAVGRSLLVVFSAFLLWELVTSTWPALLPFLAGAVIAYAVLPSVDALDRYMPRMLASALCVIAVAVGLLAAVAVVLPPLALGTIRMVAELPTRSQIDE